MDFWRRKTLSEMTQEEWERLCDRCGRCCLVKLEDEDSGCLDYTSVACRYLDIGTCECTRYAERFELDAECVQLTPAKASELQWLPSTCAYRLVANGEPLPNWHPLVSGDPASIHLAQVSVKDRACSEDLVEDDDLEDFIDEALR